MNKLLTITTLLTLFQISFVHAHGDHSGEDQPQQAKVTSNDQASKIASTIIAKFVNENQFNKTWLNSSVKDISKKTFGGKLEWVVSFFNSQIQDQSKSTLYIFLDINGKYVGSNYTGN